jgi:hypothetical protein
MQGKIMTERELKDVLKMWQSSDIWERLLTNLFCCGD